MEKLTLKDRPTKPTGEVTAPPVEPSPPPPAQHAPPQEAPPRESRSEGSGLPSRGFVVTFEAPDGTLYRSRFTATGDDSMTVVGMVENFLDIKVGGSFEFSVPFPNNEKILPRK